MMDYGILLRALRSGKKLFKTHIIFVELRASRKVFRAIYRKTSLIKRARNKMSQRIIFYRDCVSEECHKMGM